VHANDHIPERLEQMWASEAQYVRRMLIGLGRDIDLADDLLQETYLKAQGGISSYRGDNDRAWLSTIARNIFVAHLRRRYVHAEVNGDAADDAGRYSPVGCGDHLEQIRVRQAISELDPELRNALLMKHYCGFTYREIAKRMHCAVGTAKWRVSLAMDKLQEALESVEEQPMITCADLDRIKLLDYCYSALAHRTMEAIKRHVRGCAECRARLDSTGKVLSALDALEGELKHMQILEMDANGVLRLYTMSRYLNTSGEPMKTVGFCYNKGGAGPEYLAAQGEELPFTISENDNSNYPNTDCCTAKLPHPVAPGEVCDYMAIFPSWKSGAAKEQADGSWTFGWKQLTSVENDYAFAFALRLPPGARLISAEPPATETRVSPSVTTVLWRCMRAANQAFECEVKYRLSEVSDNGGTHD
jgi:RNA polymerase sigma-70 factor, ECF subfamily